MEIFDSGTAGGDLASGRGDNAKPEELSGRHLAIVDPSALRRDCFRAALGQQARRWRVSDVESAVDLIRLLHQGESFSVILLGGSTCRDIDLLELARISGAAPRTPILATADGNDSDRVRMILNSGARGFLPASLGLKALVAALERVRTGGTFVPLMGSEAKRDPSPGDAPDPPWQVLTRRQRDVLALISEGKSNKLIADALRMSESTVKAHVKQIIRRLHVANRTQAALIAAHGARHSPVRGPAAVAQGVL